MRKSPVTGLKALAPGADLPPMRRVHDLTCPICCADIPLSGDEKKGEEVFCTFCGAPCKLTGTPAVDEECGLEEDF